MTRLHTDCQIDYFDQGEGQNDGSQNNNAYNGRQHWKSILHMLMAQIFAAAVIILHMLMAQIFAAAVIW